MVFNTALCGYQEVLTDPSYAGQIVTMTYPHIGNYGVNREDVESARPQVAGFVVREASTRRLVLARLGRAHRYLDETGIVGISEIDTRALTRHLRTHGAKRGVDLDARRATATTLVARARASRSMVGLDLAREVTCAEPYAGPASARRREPVQGRGLRLRDEAEHPAHAGRRRLRRDGGARHHHRRRTRWRSSPTASSSRTAPAIPSPCTYAIEAAQGAHGRRVPDLRHLPRPPDPRPRLRRQDLQAQVRPPRRQPPGEEPARRARSRSPRRTTASPSTRSCSSSPELDADARQPQRRHGRGLPPPRAAR